MRVSSARHSCLRLHVHVRVARAYVCVCCTGRAHTMFYRGASPTSIRGMLVSSAPDNTPCSIIMRRHTPLGTQADEKSSSFLLSFPPYRCLCFCRPATKGIFFKPPFSGTGGIASTLNQLHSTSTSSVILCRASTLEHTRASTLSPYYNIAQEKPLNNAWAR